MKSLIATCSLLVGLCLLISCEQKSTTSTETTNEENTTPTTKGGLDKYTSVRLTTDISQLSDKEKQMIPILIEAAKIMDELFWYEAYGTKEKALADAKDISNTREAEFTFIMVFWGCFCS